MNFLLTLKKYFIYKSTKLKKIFKIIKSDFNCFANDFLKAFFIIKEGFFILFKNYKFN